MSLMSTIEGFLSPRLLEQLGRQTGVAESPLRSGVTGTAASLFSELAGKTGDSRAMNGVAQLINASPHEVDDVDRLVEAPADSPMRVRGNQLLGLATSDAPGLARGLGKMLGLGGSSASSLLGMVAALAMSALRHVGRSRTLDASSLATMLQSERQSFRDATPAGLRATPAFPSVAAAGPTAVSDTRSVTARPRAVPAPTRGSPWWLLAAIAAVLGIWLLTRGGHREQRGPDVRARTPSGEVRRSPTATRFSFPADSGESKFLAAAQAGRVNAAVDLDAVKFETGSSTLSPTADTQLSHVAQVLEAYPKLSVEVDGYADTTGATEQNQQLSRARAESVRDALVSHGVDASRVRTAAFGQKAQGESAPGAAGANRRVAIRIVGH